MSKESPLAGEMHPGGDPAGEMVSRRSGFIWV